MVVEILDETQSWRIDLPDEGMYVDRLLVASRGGVEVARWHYNATGWTCIQGINPELRYVVGTVGGVDLFEEILAECMKCQYVLHSVPKPAGE